MSDACLHVFSLLIARCKDIYLHWRTVLFQVWVMKIYQEATWIIYMHVQPGSVQSAQYSGLVLLIKEVVLSEIRSSVLFLCREC